MKPEPRLRPRTVRLLVPFYASFLFSFPETVAVENDALFVSFYASSLFSFSGIHFQPAIAAQVVLCLGRWFTRAPRDHQDSLATLHDFLMLIDEVDLERHHAPLWAPRFASLHDGLTDPQGVTEVHRLKEFPPEFDKGEPSPVKEIQP